MVLTVSLVHIFQQPFQVIKMFYNQIRQKDDVVKISELIDAHIGIPMHTVILKNSIKFYFFFSKIKSQFCNFN